MKDKNFENLTCHYNDKKTAFTLAETLITLSILGIVAAITIPALISRQIESQNRAKVRKAMAAYERAINQILVDNDLQTEDSFKNWANNDATTNNYAGQRSYFKIAEESTSYPNCRFKTGDGVWWDICGENKSNIENPIIILDNAYKDTARTGDDGLEALAKAENDANGKKAYVFAMVGHRDTTIGSVRVNDKSYEDGIENNTANQQYLEKLYAFNEKRMMAAVNTDGGGNNEKDDDDSGAAQDVQRINAKLDKFSNSDYSGTCTNIDVSTNGACTTCFSCTYQGESETGYPMYYTFDENGNLFLESGGANGLGCSNPNTDGCMMYMNIYDETTSDRKYTLFIESTGFTKDNLTSATCSAYDGYTCPDNFQSL